MPKALINLTFLFYMAMQIPSPSGSEYRILAIFPCVKQVFPPVFISHFIVNKP